MKEKQPARPHPPHQLMVRFSHMGDIVLTTGVLLWMGETCGTRFHVLTGKGWEDIFAEHPFVDKVVSLQTRDFGVLSLAREFRRIALQYKGWGLLDLHGNLRSRLLAACWRGPVRVYPKMSLERRLFLAGFRNRYKETLRNLSVPERYALAATTNPPSAETLRPRIFLRKEEIDRARALLSKLFGPGAVPVALHPHATHGLKAWPAERYRALGDMLEKAGIPFVCIGKGSPLFPGSPFDLTNGTSLRETCALLSQCGALVTGDSGPMHLAVAVGTPVAALFGPTVKEWGFFPLGSKDVVLERELPCRPCSLHGKSACSHGEECLRSILPEEAFAVVRRMML